MPSATAITIAEVLDLLDGRFAAMSAAIERRRFAIWVGSGISFGRAPSIGGMLQRALEHLRQRADPADASCKFRQALNEAIVKSGLDAARRALVQFGVPFDGWPERDEIIRGLWDRYADVLDIRLEGEADDYILWNAIDVRSTYGTLDDPDCEHLCIAILIMEGAVADIASANWDGLIEAAVRRLSGGAGLVQVIVDPAHLRDGPARTRLIKFHGCAVHCTLDPASYRRFLIATRPQITDWPHNPQLVALRHELRQLATNSRTLMVGLSLQDTNLQDLFAEARRALPWPWPCAPAAQGHVFCEDMLGEHQVNMLRVVYQDHYGAHRTEIEASALFRAFARQALLGMVLHLLAEKLTRLTESACSAGPLAATVGELSAGIGRLRGRVAAAADGDRLAFVNSLIRLWSRGMVLFRRGEIPPPGSGSYEMMTTLSIHEMMADPNISNSGLPELAVGLALLGRGEPTGKWSVSLPAADSIEHGVIQATGTWITATPAQIYFASSAAAAIALIEHGATTTGNVVIIHSDDAWQRMNDTGTAGRRSPIGSLGRTGQIAVRHVSMRDLLRSAADLATLEQRFEEEVTL